MNNRIISILLLICFLDMLSYAIFSPVISFLFLDGQYSLLFGAYTKHRHIWLGLFLSTYAAIQIFSAPYLGRLASIIGKKKVLSLAFIGNLAGYLFCLFSVYEKNILFLFLGAFVSGLTGANMPMIYAFISSLKPRSQWSKTFSLFGAAIGVAFTLGPFLTSILIPIWSTHMLYYVILGLCITLSSVNLILVQLNLKDTSLLPHKLRQETPTLPLHQLIKLSQPMRHLLFFLFCLYFSWFSFIKFFQVFLFENQQLAEYHCCQLTSYLGLLCAIWQGLRYVYHHPFFEEKIFLIICTTLMGISLGSYFLSSSLLHILCYMALITYFYSNLIPSVLSLLFQKTTMTKELTASLYQSIQSIAKILAPICAGLLTSLSSSTPFFMSSTIFIAVLILFRFPKSFIKPKKNILFQ